MKKVELEFDNGYTLVHDGGRTFISNQRVAKRLPYYQTPEYLRNISKDGKFEFFDLNEVELDKLIRKIKRLPEYKE